MLVGLTFATGGLLCEEQLTILKGPFFRAIRARWRAVALTLGLCLVVGSAAYWAFLRSSSRKSVEVGPSPPRLELVVRLALEGPPLSEDALSAVEVQAFLLGEDGRYRQGQKCERLKNLGQVLECRLVAGRYWILGRVPGFARFERALELKANQPPLELGIELTVAHRLTVDVRTRNEGEELLPLENATVLVRGVAPALSVAAPALLPFGALTNAQGRAELSELTQPPYQLQVFARGYEPYEAVVSADPLIVLKPVRTLAIEVKDQGRAVPQATVHVAGASLWPSRNIQANEHGKALVSGLKAGRYALTAEAGERISLSPTFVELEAEIGTTLAVVELGVGRALSLTVKDNGNSAPIAQAQVSWVPNSPFEPLKLGVTNEKGELRLSPLAALYGTLQVSAQGYVPRTVLHEGEASRIVALERGGTVRGRVLDEAGSPVSGATVRILGHDNHGMPILHAADPGCVKDAHFAWADREASRLLPAGELGVTMGPVPPIPLFLRAGGPCPTASATQSSQLLTDSDGRFVAFGVAPGTVVALAEHPNYQGGRSSALVLESGATVSCEVRMRAGTPLRGRVLDDRDFPVPGTLVRVTTRDFERNVTTSADGSFEIAAAPDTVVVRVFPRDGQMSAALEERIEGERRNKEIVLRLRPAREKVRFVVQDEDGHALELAEVRVRSEQEGEPFQETRFTDAVGEAELAHARGLVASLRVVAPGHVALETERKLGELETVKLVRATRAEGRVTAVRGRWPGVNADVRLQCGDGSYRTLSDDTGHYSFAGVPRGTCRLTASQTEQGFAALDVEIGATEFGRAFGLPDLDLAPPVRVHGIVRQVTGEPAPGAIVSRVPLPPYLPLDLAELPEPWTRADPEGRFEFALHFEGAPRLYALWPAMGRGEASFQSTNLEEENLALSISLADEAPPDALATLLVGLRERGGKVLIDVLLPDYPATKKLRAGDEIRAIDGEAPTSVAEARAWLSGSIGSDVELNVVRGSQSFVFKMKRQPFLRARE